MKRPTWLKLDLLAPIVTILVAATVPALYSLGIIQLTVGEGFIIGLIAVLAIDALIERVKVLNEIRNDVKQLMLRSLTSQDVFQTRPSSPLEDRLANAKSLDIAAPSLNAIAKTQHDLLLKKASEGCKIRLLLLNPHNEELMKYTYLLMGATSPEEQKGEILSSLDRFTNHNPYLQSGLLQIRMHDYPLTHGLFITNSDMPNGKLRVETYIKDRRPNRTPGFVVHKATDPWTFNQYTNEFNDLWDKAQSPTTSSGSTAP